MPRQLLTKGIKAKRTPQTSVEEIVRACGQFILSNQYEAALKLLTTINRHDNGPPRDQFVNLLALRAAAYVGLGELNYALKDARAMLELDPKDARGYGEAAEIELERGNPYTAIAHLQDGLEFARYPDSLVERLSSNLQAYEDQIASSAILSRPKDPMADLPTEVVELIFSYLDYRQHIQLLSVSRAWNQVLLSFSPLIDTLAFPEASKKITPKMLDVALRRWEAPKTLNIANLTDHSVDALMARLQHGRGLSCLERIEVRDSLFMAWTLSLHKFNLKAISLDHQTAVTSEWIGNVLLPQCPRLEVARFGHVYHAGSDVTLRSKTLLGLDLTFPLDRSLEYVKLDNDFYCGLPSLNTLSCAGIWLPNITSTLDLRHMKHLRSLKFTEADLPNIFLPSSLETLDLNDCLFPDYSDPESKSCKTVSFPALNNLNTLKITVDEYPEFILQAAAKSQPGKLTTCYAGEDSYTLPGFLQLLKNDWFREVQVLHLDRTKLADAHSSTITSGCPRLRKLYIEDPHHITGLFVSETIEGLGSTLEKITIRGWDNADTATIPWARDRGVEVEILPAQPLRGPF